MRLDEDKLLEKILEEGKEAVDEREERIKRVINGQKRYSAMRSVLSLDNDIKEKPWRGASNLGVPIDATIIFTMLARYMKSTFNIDPIVNVLPGGESDMPFAPLMEQYINWELTEEMQVTMDFYLLYLAMLRDGDRVIKTIWDRDEVYYEEGTYYLVNDAGEVLRDEEGQPVEVEKGQQMYLQGQLYVSQKSEEKAIKRNVIYNGPRLVNIPIQNIIVPNDADTADCSKLDWIIHEIFRPLSWFRQKEEQEIFPPGVTAKLEKLKNERENRMYQVAQMSGKNINIKKFTNRYRVWEWHGRYNNYEIIALVDADNKMLLGYIPNHFYNRTGMRQFVHYQAFPEPDSFYGRSVGDWLKGLRTVLDMSVNQWIDRGTIYNNPPLVYGRMSDFNPSKHKFGPGRSWGLSDINQVKFLTTPQNERNTIIFQEFIFGLIQRLFGITDYNVGARTLPGMMGSTAANKTASGIMALIQEANIIFEMRLDLVQKWANPIFVQQIAKHNALNVSEEKVFRVTEGENPFVHISPQELKGNYDFVFKGNTVTTNKMLERQDTEQLYRLFFETQNPFVINNPRVLKQLSQELLDVYDKKYIKLDEQ